MAKSYDPIGQVGYSPDSDRLGYKVSENVRVVAKDSSPKVVTVTSGAKQAAYENISGKTGTRLAPSSPTKGANMDKPYPKPQGTQSGHHVTTGKNHTKSRGAAGGSLGAIGGGGMDWETK